MNFEGAIFLIRDDETLVELREHAYDSEALLQKLLADYPSLLAGEQVNRASPRRWLLVRREAGVPSKSDGGNQWAIDNLFLDQEGIPTIVEVKRSTDTRIRREVVGQMLDYAANAVAYWPAARIRSMFDEWYQGRGEDPSQVLSEFLNQATEAEGTPLSEESFWQAVEANLQAHRVRMIFVADAIPPELQRIIEFLNEQTTTAEVLGLEIKQYVGQAARTLVPRVIGLTAQAQANKTGGPVVAWDEQRFLASMRERAGTEVAEIAKRLLDSLTAKGWQLMWGHGSIDGSSQPVFRYKGGNLWPMFVWTSGRIQLQYGHLVATPPFDDLKLRVELRDRLRKIPDLVIPDEVDKYPSFQMSVLLGAGALASILETWQWTADELSAYQDRQQTAAV
jgi:hypothetical protein